MLQKGLTQPYPHKTLIAWQVLGINDLVMEFGDSTHIVFHNFRTALNRLAKLAESHEIECL